MNKKLTHLEKCTILSIIVNIYSSYTHNWTLQPTVAFTCYTELWTHLSLFNRILINKKSHLIIQYADCWIYLQPYEGRQHAVKIYINMIWFFSCFCIKKLFIYFCDNTDTYQRYIVILISFFLTWFLRNRYLF